MEIKGADVTYIQNDTITTLVPIIPMRPSKKEVIQKLEKFIKRSVDIFGSLIGMFFLIPLTIIVYIANLITGDRGPIFYTHTRIGKNGKHFDMFKFRSMCVDSDQKLKEMLENDPKIREEWEKNHKLENDCRITKIGKFLRKTSLDEFPQFLNVLKGEMSLVGPRAVVDNEIDKFGMMKYKVLSVKPGITGYWAAHGRSNTTYEERVIMEATYVERFSIMLDFKILVKTFVSVVKKEGAV